MYYLISLAHNLRKKLTVNIRTVNPEVSLRIIHILVDSSFETICTILLFSRFCITHGSKLS